MHIWLGTLVLLWGTVAARADDVVPPHVSSFCATLLYSAEWTTFGPPAEVPYYIKSLVLRANDRAHAFAASRGVDADVGPTNKTLALIVDDDVVRSGLVTLEELEHLAGRTGAMAGDLERSHVVSVARFVRGAGPIRAFLKESMTRVRALEVLAESPLPPAPPIVRTRLHAAAAVARAAGPGLAAYLVGVAAVHSVTHPIVAGAFDVLGAWILSGPMVDAWHSERGVRKHELNQRTLWEQVFGPGTRLLQYEHVLAHIEEDLKAPGASPVVFYGGFSMITRELYDEFIRAGSLAQFDAGVLRDSIDRIGDRMLGADLFTVCMAFVDQAFFYDGDEPVLLNVVRLIDPLKIPAPPTSKPRREVHEDARPATDWLPGLRPVGI